MKNNLEEKLINFSKKKVDSNDADISSIKLLLASEAAEEANILKAVGLDHHIRIAQNKQGDNIIRTTGEQKFGKPVVALAEIERLCLDYRLYMRKANEYIGNIPSDLAVELKHFCQKCSIDTSNTSSNDYSDFYIIAPPKMFKGYNSPLDNLLGGIVDTSNQIREEREARLRAKQRDPILVYKDPNNAGYYAIVKSWGNDFTPLRKLYAFATKKRNINLFISLLQYIGIPCMIFLFYAFMNNGETLMDSRENQISILNFLIQVVSVIAIVVIFIWTTTGNHIIRPFKFNLINRVCKKPINNNHYNKNRY